MDRKILLHYYCTYNTVFRKLFYIILILGDWYIFIYLLIIDKLSQIFRNIVVKYRKNNTPNSRYEIQIGGILPCVLISSDSDLGVMVHSLWRHWCVPSDKVIILPWEDTRHFKIVVFQPLLLIFRSEQILVLYFFCTYVVFQFHAFFYIVF